MRFSIEELRSYRHQFLEPIYPGFSLEAVFDQRQKQMLQSRRGDNAYSITKPADTHEEYSRLVRRELNKLTESNFSSILDSLKVRPLVIVKEYRQEMIDIIHNKALQEPECAKNYAAACRELVEFSHEQLKNKTNKTEDDFVFRSELIAKVQKEFEKALTTPVIDDAALGITEDTPAYDVALIREEARTAWMRRKLANICFIGELYLHKVFKFGAMQLILVKVLSEKNKPPPSGDNVEMIVKLLRVIGSQFAKEDPVTLTCSLNQLDALRKAPSVYPLRIQFMIADLIALQKNGWKSTYELNVAGPSSPTSNRDRFRGIASPTSRGGQRGGTFGPTWREAFKREGAGAAAEKAVSAVPKPVDSKPAQAASAGRSPALVSPLQSSVVPFRTLVRTTLSDWVMHRDNEPIAEWTKLFSQSDRVFESDVELGVAVAAEVIFSACMTTHPGAQQEGMSFCSVGLDLSDDELLGGFARSLARAINDDLVEDCPKFPERWMWMLNAIAGGLTNLHFDLGSICRDAYQHMVTLHAEEDEEDELPFVLDTMRLFWNAAPETPEDGWLDAVAIVALIENTEGEPKEGLDKVLAAYIFHLFEMGVLPENIIDLLQQHQCVKQEALFNQVVEGLSKAVFMASQ